MDKQLQKEKLGHEIESLLEVQIKRELSADEAQKLDNMRTEFFTIKREIREQSVDHDKVVNALTATFEETKEDKIKREVEAFYGMLENKDDEKIKRALTKGELGFNVPQDLAQSVIYDDASNAGIVEAGARVIRVNNFLNPGYPVADKTVEGAVATENVDAGDNAATLASVNAPLYHYTSKGIQVSDMLAVSGGSSVWEIVKEQGSASAWRKIANDSINGDGTAKITGVLNDSVAVDSASVGTLAKEDFRTLFHSVDSVWRKNAKWMVSDSIFQIISGYTYAEGETRIYDYRTDKFYGNKDYIITPHLSGTVATGNDVALFGDFSAYYLRLYNQPQIKKVENSTGYEAFFNIFSGGVLSVPNAIKHLNIA